MQPQGYPPQVPQGVPQGHPWGPPPPAPLRRLTTCRGPLPGVGVPRGRSLWGLGLPREGGAGWGPCTLQVAQPVGAPGGRRRGPPAARPRYDIEPHADLRRW